jgi:Fur family transcriptional regulator, ferric uptake regulator
MNKSQKIIEDLRVKNHRITQTREAILHILSDAKQPLSPADMAKLLKKNSISVNKTTIYREIDFLKNQKIIRELRIDDTAKHYELIPDDHHHHLICLDCRKIEHVELAGDLDREEKKIIKNTKFKILNHSLEFYGICKSCQ